jgi:formate hydrogenlyase subunit 3/multisubunit Na+/H+ antiporter MnhD subunit
MMNFISSFLSKGANLIWFMIALPVALGILVWFFRKYYIPRLMLVVSSSIINFVLALALYQSEGFYLTFPFASYGLDIAFHIHEFSSMFLTFAAVGFLLIGLYNIVYMKKQSYAGLFMFYMYSSLAMINGALMSDNLGVMLFFWEGLLCTLFGMLLIHNLKNPKTAVRALVLSGTADLLLMLGIIITVFQAGTPHISQMEKLPLSGTAGIGFVCMMLGAVGKAGCMPFHSWIPSAAEDAPTPFMVAFPGALEKLLGIYLSVRIVTDIYDLQPGSGMSTVIMVLGTLTIIFAVAMALIQKDMKRLLSYHAISQVGYMVLGIGTALPIGIVGGLFHMLNNAVYKSCLYMTAGSIEKQTGTTDLRKIGGLAKSMPFTAACFVLCALGIAGVPPFNGFFSKELIFDAALESHIIFYIGALLGAFMTAVSFLKMGRAAFAGELKLSLGRKAPRESSFGMLLPMGVLAILCLVFGVVNTWPLDSLISSSLGITEVYSGWPHSTALVVISLVVLALALCDHIYGCKKTGSAIRAADHIHYAFGLRSIYQAAEKQWFDPYRWILYIAGVFSDLCVLIERGVSWFYDTAAVKVLLGTGDLMQRFNNGSLSRYLAAAVIGAVGVAVIFIVMFL